jgi:hypothetical protein
MWGQRSTRLSPDGTGDQRRWHTGRVGGDSPRNRRHRPGVECLEDRRLPSAITQFPLPASDLLPGGLTVGPDGNLWFTGYAASGSAVVGRITPSGVVTEFPLPAGDSPLAGLTVGQDGNLWCPVDSSPPAGAIDRITPSGVVTEFPLPAGFAPGGSLTVGPDGNLWFPEGPFLPNTTVPAVIGNVDPTPPRITRVIAVVNSRGAITSILLVFEGALDADTASEAVFYSLTLGVKRGRTIVFSRGVKIERVSYNQSAHTVRLKLARPRNRPVQVTVRAGVVAADGMSSFSDFTAVVKSSHGLPGYGGPKPPRRDAVLLPGHVRPAARSG